MQEIKVTSKVDLNLTTDLHNPTYRLMGQVQVVRGQPFHTVNRKYKDDFQTTEDSKKRQQKLIRIHELYGTMNILVYKSNTDFGSITTFFAIYVYL